VAELGKTELDDTGRDDIIKLEVFGEMINFGNVNFKLYDSKIIDIVNHRNHLVVFTEGGWRLPVKYKISFERAMLMLCHISRCDITELRNDEIKDNGLRQTSWCGSRNLRNSGINEIEMKWKSLRNVSVRMLVRNLIAFMQPVSDVTFNANSMYQNKVIVDTWEVELSMGKEGMTAISKQHHVEQIRVTNVCSVLFYRDQCVLASKDLRLMVEDKGSVGKLRRRMKASRHDLNLDRTVIGTTVMYHTNTGRESVAHSIIRNLVKNNDHGREVMGWREAMCALGIMDTPGICSSLGDNGNEDIVYCNPDEGEVPIRKKKTARGGKKKKKKSSPKHVSESAWGGRRRGCGASNSEVEARQGDKDQTVEASLPEYIRLKEAHSKEVQGFG